MLSSQRHLFYEFSKPGKNTSSPQTCLALRLMPFLAARRQKTPQTVWYCPVLSFPYLERLYAPEIYLKVIVGG